MRIAALKFMDDETNSTREILGYFEDIRTKFKPEEDGIFRYQIRSDDDGKGDPVTVEQAVMVNHYGDFITDTKIDFTKDYEYRNLPEDICPIEYCDDISIEDDCIELDDIKENLEALRLEELMSMISYNLGKGSPEDDSRFKIISTEENLDRICGSLNVSFYGKEYLIQVNNIEDFL